MLQAIVIATAVVLIIAGIFNGSARDVLYKAITICTECVGLG
ncbi:MAG: thioredoxin [Clostridia bacterium]|nr:thioredoxin [Clostridia bacterium]